MTARHELSGSEFATALISGFHRVIAEQELLNRINVFPVADSDTGTNLSLSLASALGVLTDARDEHLGTLLASVADALLDGARGNSGAIMAQFFQGMSDASEDIERLSAGDFARAAQAGSDYAHDALSQPRKGTILSAIAAFSDSVQRTDLDFVAMFRQARNRVDDAVLETPTQLDVLRKAGVVDAGAKGFAELVAGMADYIVEGRVAPMPETGLHRDLEAPASAIEPPVESAYRFCTECIVTGIDIDRRRLREALAGVGDSLVLAGTKHKAKIHIHANSPDDVFALASGFGEVSGRKADDMLRQQRSSHTPARHFAVITDSAADISERDMARLDIHMVPLRIQFGDRGYLDKLSISTEEFYSELENNAHHPTTSQPAPGDFRRQFQFLASHFRDVISINLTSRASGTYEAARSAASRIRAAGHVHVVDSRNASTGQGQLVTLAAECAQAGLDVEQTLSMLDEHISQTRTWALLEELRYAVRGGRLPAWVQRFANLLRLSPIIGTSPSGEVRLAGFLFGHQARRTKFARFVARRAAKVEKLELGIGHAVCADNAEQLAQDLRRRLPNIDRLTICDLGTALGVHGGPGTLIVSAAPGRTLPDRT